MYLKLSNQGKQMGYHPWSSPLIHLKRVFTSLKAAEHHVKFTKLSDVDVFFPVLHGTFGEDGTLQGLFELADVAYVGAGVLGSSVGMDKGLFKDVMRSNGIPDA